MPATRHLPVLTAFIDNRAPYQGPVPVGFQSKLR